MRRAIFLLVLGLLFMSVASALPTRINISLVETVNQNVTYAENFYLTESTTTCEIIGILNVTNPSPDTVDDIYINFSNTDTMSTNFTLIAGRYGSQTLGSAPGDVFQVHIPQLRAGNFSTFNYNMSCGSVQPPLDINTSYGNVEHGFNRKVLAGHTWQVNQSASNVLAVGQNVNDINISIQVNGILWNGTNSLFSLDELYELGDFANLHGNGTSNTSWYWQASAGTLVPGETVWIQYNVTAPNNVPTSDTYKAITETLRYNISYLASNLSLDSVIASAQAHDHLTKRIVQPADNENNTNVTWEARSNVTTPINIAYRLTKLSMWVTTTLNMTNRTTDFGLLNSTVYPNQEINLSTGYLSTAWEFNFTDGSDPVTSPPPVVWMLPYFNIINAYNQILNSTYTRNGNDYYMKYIYVVNGYWLEVHKDVVSTYEDQYRIDILVENIGNDWTPQHLVVTVYDFVPSEFTPFNYTYSRTPDASANVTNTEFNGTTHQWNIPLKNPYNSSLGPISESYNNRTWNVSYWVNGSGDYRASELYIVGLDPRKVDGAGGSEAILMRSVLGTRTRELFYVGLVVFLIAINVANVLMTRQINHKLRKYK
ncbi:MAG: hypothetical protein H6502_01055 [Candidatus Woesearchaeota archaeon]|nr:MAG: hypothetical protein H6502_01055 [Candidatus Woesearchaeota archaeon]